MKAHLKNIYINKPSILLMIITLIFFCCAFFIIGKQILLRLTQIDFYKKYNFVCDSNYSINSTSYFDISENVSIHIFHHSQTESCNCAIHSIKLMQQKEYNGNKRLVNNEVCISKNISIDYDLHIGSAVYVFDFRINEPIEYKVADVLDECIFGLHDIDFFYTSGVIIFAYDDELSNYSSKYITFVEDKNAILNMENIIIHDLKKELNWLIVTIVIIYTSLFITSIVTMLLLYNFISATFFDRISVRKRMGEYLTTLKKDILVSSLPLLILFLIPCFIPLVFMRTFGRYSLFIVGLNAFVLLIGFIIFALLEFKRGKVYQ